MYSVGLFFMPVCVSVVVIVCVHACGALPSAALDRVGSAQQGAWSLGLRGGGEHVYAQDSKKDKEKAWKESLRLPGSEVGALRTRKRRDAGEQEERSGCGQRGGGREGARGIRNEI